MSLGERPDEPSGAVGGWWLEYGSTMARWTPSMFGLYGVPRADSVPKDVWYDRIHEDDRPTVDRMLAQLAECPDPEPLTFRVVRPDGSLRYVRAHAHIATEPSGEPAFVYGTAEDITAEIDALSATLEAAKQIRAISESALDAIVTCDPTGTVLDWNPAAQRMFGFTAGEILGQSVEALMPARFVPSHRDGMARLPSGWEGPLQDGKVRRLAGRRRDGSEFPLEMTLSAWVVDDLQRVTAIIRDVTAHVAVEQQLRHERDLAALLEAVTAAANSTSRLEEALDATIDLICERTGWALGHAWRVVALGGPPELQSLDVWRGPSAAALERFHRRSDELRLGSGEGLPGTVLLRRRPVWVEDFAGAGFPRSPIAMEVGLRGAFAMPILVGDDVVAVVEVFSPERATEDPKFAEAMVAVGTQLGRVVERERVAADLEERATLQGLLADVRAAFSGPTDLVRAAEVTGEAIQRRLGALATGIWLTTSSDGPLLVAHAGDPSALRHPTEDSDDLEWGEGPEALDRLARTLPLVLDGALLGHLAVSCSRPMSAAVHETLALVAHELANGVHRLRSSALISDSERRFRAVLDHASDFLTIHAADGTVRHAGTTVSRIFGWDPEEVVGSDGFGFAHPADRTRIKVWFAEAVRYPEHIKPLECRLRSKDGTWTAVELRASNLINEPAVGGVVLRARDLTELRRVEADLAFQKLHDPLTRLPLRALLLDRLERALDRAVRQDWATAVLCVDVDQLRAVNDQYGLEVGDRVLVATAERLESVLRGYDSVSRLYDLVARLGGDEFYVLCEHVDPSDALALADRILKAVQQPIQAGELQLEVSVSIGIAIVEPGEPDPPGMLAAADTAMRMAKAKAPPIEFYAEEMRRASYERVAREHALRAALENGELRLLYQPKVSLADHRVVGVEALLRWEHPEDGPISPVEFIPVAESSGLIVPIGAWVLEEACRTAAEWQRLRPELPLSIAVNVSAKQFNDDLSNTVRAALNESGLEPQRLYLEVTESILMTDSHLAAGLLQELKDLGLGISIDDFGTGYSSLAYLKRFPISELKIDRAFVNGLGVSPEDTAIVAAIVAMAHALDIDVVAEGVETLDQLERLHAIGSDSAQGFYFSRPQASAVIDALLEGTMRLKDLGSTPDQAPAPNRSLRVLVVDDDPVIRQIARVTLATAGFEVREASDAIEALAIARSMRPDAVLLDVSLGRDDGFTVCRNLRRDPETAGCTIIMVTAEAGRQDRIMAFSLGADDYVIKPFSPRDLLGRVRAAVGRRQST